MKPEKPLRMFPLLLLTLLAIPSRAYEVDNFTQRAVPLNDAGSVVDVETNRRIDQAIRKANEKNKGGLIGGPEPCGETALYAQLKSVLDGNPVGEIERFVQEDSKIVRSSTQSPHIYSEGAGAFLWSAGIEASVKVNGHFIGADKFGHFMGQGFDYFKMIHKEGRSEEDALKYGIELEEGVYGLASTGVKSYGDLAANYSGLHFWRQVLEGNDPYIKCVNGEFVKKRDFHWKDYASDGWDEGINCSEFSPRMQSAFDKGMSKLKLSCPVDPKACVPLAAQANSRLFLSPACRAAAAAELAKTPQPTSKAASVPAVTPPRASTASAVKDGHYSAHLSCFDALSGKVEGLNMVTSLGAKGIGSAGGPVTIPGRRGKKAGFYVYTSEGAFFFEYPKAACKNTPQRTTFRVKIFLPGEASSRELLLEVGVKESYQNLIAPPPDTDQCAVTQLKGAESQAMDSASDSLLEGILMYKLGKVSDSRQDLSACRKVDSASVRYAINQAEKRGKSGASGAVPGDVGSRSAKPE